MSALVLEYPPLRKIQNAPFRQSSERKIQYNSANRATCRSNDIAHAREQAKRKTTKSFHGEYSTTENIGFDIDIFF